MLDYLLHFISHGYMFQDVYYDRYIAYASILLVK